MDRNHSDRTWPLADPAPKDPTETAAAPRATSEVTPRGALSATTVPPPPFCSHTGSVIARDRWLDPPRSVTAETTTLPPPPPPPPPASAPFSLSRGRWRREFSLACPPAAVVHFDVITDGADYAIDPVLHHRHRTRQPRPDGSNFPRLVCSYVLLSRDSRLFLLRQRFPRGDCDRGGRRVAYRLRPAHPPRSRSVLHFPPQSLSHLLDRSLARLQHARAARPPACFLAS